MVEVIAMNILYEADLQEYIFKELVKRGYAPTEEEADEVGSICFDYLFEKGVLE
jgi:hypothetical protein